MTTQLPTTGFGGAGTGLMARSQFSQGMAKAAQQVPTVSDKPFLKMDKGDGTWLFGQDETICEVDALWAVNPMSYKHGWVCWDRNKDTGGGPPIAEVMVPFTMLRPALENLPAIPQGQGWDEQASFELMCLSGADNGVTVEYKQSSVGAMKLFSTTTNEMATRSNESDAFVPIILLRGKSYKHSKWGRIFNPIFEVQQWVTMEGVSPGAATAPQAPAPTPPAALQAAAARATGAPATAPAPAAVMAATAPSPDNAKRVRGGGISVGSEAELTDLYNKEAAAAAANAAPSAAEPRRRTRRA